MAAPNTGMFAIQRNASSFAGFPPSCRRALAGIAGK
jgi:hypothetical protein